jgi:hypothetical protein
MRSSHSPSALAVTFDDTHAVAHAGLALVGVLSEKLGLEEVVDERVDLAERPGHHRPGRKVATLVHAMVAGADCIDDADLLRSGATADVLPHEVMAPSTLGTFLRSFTFGHVRQLDAATEELLTRAWAGGTSPVDEPMTIDMDSTICEVCGYDKQGATFGYTKVRGLHPLLATRADTGEVLHLRMRKGSANTGRGAARFVRELAGRVRRAGATGPLTLRADSGFWSKYVIAACRDHDVRYSITVNQNQWVHRAILAIDEEVWQGIDYTRGGVAQVAETSYGDGHRLVVRRTRFISAQGELLYDWRYHAFITDREGTAVELDADHRAHARVELAIRDLKEGAGLCHCPSGRFGANAAWALCAVLAHNLLRWTAALGTGHQGFLVAKTVRRQLLDLPGRLTTSGRKRTLHLPAHWPWRHGWLACFEQLRALPLVT